MQYFSFIACLQKIAIAQAQWRFRRKAVGDAVVFRDVAFAMIFDGVRCENCTSVSYVHLCADTRVVGCRQYATHEHMHD
jgi:hypothetical protein